MPFIIQNRAKHLLVLPLNSGGTLHLAPGETSSPVAEFEIENNEKVERLLNEGLIAVTEPNAAPQDEDEAEGVAPPSGGKERRRGSGRN
jgi:hypothetical protein